MIRSVAVTDTQTPEGELEQVDEVISPIDFDALFADRFKKRSDDAAGRFTLITMFGRTWHLVEPNVVTMLKVTDLEKNPSGMLDFIRGSFQGEEGTQFLAELEAVAGLDGETLAEVFAKITEVQAEGRPTKPSRASRRTRSTGRRSQS